MEENWLVRCGVVLEKMEDDEEDIILKKRIACHPMFDLLKETHLKCVKVCLGHEDDAGVEASELQLMSKSHKDNLSDLDLFMEQYCTNLLELKNAIQQPMQEAFACVELMQCLLDEFTHPPAPIIPLASLDGKENVGVEECKCIVLCCCKGAVETMEEEMGKFRIRNNCSNKLASHSRSLWSSAPSTKTKTDKY